MNTRIPTFGRRAAAFAFAILAGTSAGCLTQPAPYIPGSTIESAERMAPVTDVPYTGDIEYIDAAQSYGLRSRRGGPYYGPYYGY